MTAAAIASLSAAEPVALARAVIARHSKSFALAARLLPPRVRDDAVVLYAYCRRVDDAIDCAQPAEQAGALAALRAELDAVYGSRPLRDPLLAAFQRVVRSRAIPRAYAQELLAGMRMDVTGTRYATFDQLLRYCHRAAGSVGLMMCHVMGVRRPRALLHAAHLGIAMQLTNIARDVLEDWDRGRLYLPDELLAAHGAGGLRARLGAPIPHSALPAVMAAVSVLLDRADAYYRSADVGVRELSLRCGLGVRAARLVYAQIGRVLRARDCDPRSGRAVVSFATKAVLLLRAALRTLLSLPRMPWSAPPRLPRTELSLCDAIALPGGPR
jgi:phytoene synthase